MAVIFTISNSDQSNALGTETPRVVTQTITRPSTTITALVTLGSDSGPDSGPGSGSGCNCNPAGSTGPAATLATGGPTSTSTGAALPVTPSANGGLSDAAVGAIVGSVIGFVVLVLLIVCCCLSLRRRRGSVLERSTLSSRSSETSSSWTPTEVAVEDTWRARQAEAARPGPTVGPQPPRFPPTPLFGGYRTTQHTQIKGVRRYP